MTRDMETTIKQNLDQALSEFKAKSFQPTETTQPEGGDYVTKAQLIEKLESYVPTSLLQTLQQDLSSKAPLSAFQAMHSTTLQEISRLEQVSQSMSDDIPSTLEKKFSDAIRDKVIDLKQDSDLRYARAPRLKQEAERFQKMFDETEKQNKFILEQMQRFDTKVSACLSSLEDKLNCRDAELQYCSYGNLKEVYGRIVPQMRNFEETMSQYVREFEV